MYGQFYEPNVNANSTSAIQPISQIAHNIRHGLNGAAIIAPNDEHMAHQHQQHSLHAQSQHQHQQHQLQPQRQNSRQDKDRINVLAIPATTVVGSQVIVGDASSTSERSYTPVKGVGDGSFGTVWLCDWHTPLPPSISLAPMQQGAGAKPEWQGKRLVAIKRMKKRWDGGWDECRRHPELESLRTIPPHENVIPLYDCFLLPTTKELYFVFECMEGNLYQLIKSRKGRPLAGGLVSSIFRQTCKGLAHVHDAGYFHRDMKPENLLVTTTGLTDYTPVSPLAPPGAPHEKDVVVIIKLADFGLARLIKSKPPYTEYVSTRWYRAPEVLLQSTDYTAPVDLWALGTIMAEVVNLKPLFPGTNGPDQLQRICRILGDPSDLYGFDSHGRPKGGGAWSKGLKMAKKTGILFDKAQPLDFFGLFETSVPHSLVDCILQLLRYDPEARLTAHACLAHVYFKETEPKVMYPPLNMPRRHLSSAGSGHSSSSRNGPLAAVSPRTIPPSHSHSAPRHAQHHSRHHHPYSNGVTNSHRHPFVPQPPVMINGDMDMSPADGVVEVDRNNHPIRPYQGHYRQNSHPDRMVIDQQEINNPAGKSGMFGFGKKLVGTMFGQNDKQMSLAPVEEITFASRSTPSLKDTPSTSAESRSLPEVVSSLSQLPIPPPVPLPPPVLPPTDLKKLKKEQDRLMKQAEMERRANMERMQRDRSRAVVAKRNQLAQAKSPAFEFQNVNAGRLAVGPTRPKTKVSKEELNAFGDGIVPPSVLAANAANGYGANSLKSTGNGTKQRSLQHANSAILAATYDHRNPKWKKGDDDEQSISSSDVQSVGRMSVISFATVDSDPGPGRPLHRRQSNYGYGLSPRPVGTATSISSQSYTNSPRSSHSVEPSMRSGGSIDAQFASDFEARATFAAATGNPLYSPGLHAPQLTHRHSASPTGPTEYADSMSPPNMQFLTLAGSPSHPPWTLESNNGSANGDVGSADSNSVSTLGSRRAPGPAMISMHNIVHGQYPAQHPSPSGYEYFAHSRSHPPTPHSEVNPIFYVPPPVPSLPATSQANMATSLPPFSTLASVVDMNAHPPHQMESYQYPLDQPP